MRKYSTRLAVLFVAVFGMETTSLRASGTADLSPWTAPPADPIEAAGLHNRCALFLEGVTQSQTANSVIERFLGRLGNRAQSSVHTLALSEDRHIRIVRVSPHWLRKNRADLSSFGKAVEQAFTAGPVSPTSALVPRASLNRFLTAMPRGHFYPSLLMAMAPLGWILGENFPDKQLTFAPLWIAGVLGGVINLALGLIYFELLEDHVRASNGSATYFNGLEICSRLAKMITALEMDLNFGQTGILVVVTPDWLVGHPHEPLADEFAGPVKSRFEKTMRALGFHPE